jgi:DNA-binding NarL/FixJ family response regulator
MPAMDGIATAKWLTDHYPVTKLVAFSMYTSDAEVIAMIKAGCVAYLSKDVHPEYLELALNEVVTKGFYFENFDDKSYDRICNKMYRLKPKRSLLDWF